MPDPPAPRSRFVPPRIGRYEVLLPIASGGMATVYLARSQGARGFAREVAIKLTHAHLVDEASEFVAILLEEARIASRIRHRNVVSILDVGEDPLGLFLVMDYVEGDTLAGLQRSALAASEPIPPRIGVRILLDALAGLHAAHELRDESGSPMAVVHRDFSPQNILVGVDGVAQLADFGIAKAADRGADTATGVVKGKVAYMSPEHARSHPIDRRADVWSAGVVAWEIFAGQRLHPTARDGVATLLKVISETPPLLGKVVAGIPQEVEAVVARALEPRVELRSATAAIFARDLANAFGIIGRLAEHEEVAEYVRCRSGLKLEKRRAQVHDALRLQDKMAALAEASVAEGSSRTPLGTDAQGPAHGAPDPDATALDHTVPSTPSLLSTPSSLTETAAASDTPRGSLHAEAPGRRRWKWYGRASALAAVGGVAALLLARGRTHSTEAPVAAATLMVSNTGAGGSQGSPEPGGVAAPTPAPEPAPAPPTSVRLHASSKIRALRINTRALPVDPPATEVMFERLAEDGSGPLTVQCVAVDGRKRSVTLSPAASVLEVDFPAPAVARPSAPAPARPASTQAPREGSDIPPNPFGRPGPAKNPPGTP